MTKHYDLIVIGAGSAGLTAAEAAAKLELKVALIEKHRVGGDCTWTGCIPSKALIKAAKVAHEARTAGQYGIITAPPQVDMQKVRDYVMGAIDEIYQHETPEVLGTKNIDVILGAANFVDAHRIQVGEQYFRGKHFIIATGSKPIIPSIPGLDQVPYFTSDQIFDNARLPEHLVVIGAGPMGCELGQSYRRLGSKVTLIDEKLLPNEDRKTTGVIQRVFEREGLRFIPGLVSGARQEAEEIVLTVNGKELRGDMLLVAAGRAPNVGDLGLKNAAVVHSEAGIPVDKNLRTNIKHIYAVGDCVEGNALFTHLAAWQAAQAVRNAVFPLNSSGFTDFMPVAIFTDPEIARVGLTEAQAREQYGEKLRVARLDLNRVDRAVCKNDVDGFIKLIYTSSNKLLGATIIAERAGETITEFTLALQHKLNLIDLSTAIHVYPTYSSSAQLLMAEALAENLLASAYGKLAKTLAR